MFPDDENHDGDQKGSFWDWLLTFFLIRKKTKQQLSKEVKTDKKEDKVETIVTEEQLEVLTITSPIEIINRKSAGISLDDQLTTPKDQAPSFIEIFIDIDRELKEDNPDNKKIVKLVDEASKLIKKQLHKCKDDLDDLDVKINDTIKKEEADKLQKELNDIYNKMILLRNRVKSLREGKFYDYDLDEDQKILSKVKELGEFATSEHILDIIELCDDKLLKIIDFIYLEEKEQLVKGNLDTKESDIKNRDDKFDGSKKKYALIKDAESLILVAINEQEREIAKIKLEMASLEPTFQSITHIEGFGRVFGNTLKLIWGIMALSLSGTKSKLFGSILIANSIKGLKKGITFSEEKVGYYEYSKFNHVINSTVERLDDIDYILAGSLKDLQELRIDYAVRFKEFQNVLPEYNEYFEKVNKLEQKLVKEREKVQRMTDRIKAQKKQDKVLTKTKEAA